MDERKRHSFEWVGDDLYVLFDGVKVAVRGKPMSGHFGRWIAVEPGFEVFEAADGNSIVIRRNGVRVH